MPEIAANLNASFPEWMLGYLDMVLPMQAIAIEVTTYCNSQCRYCPHSQLKYYHHMAHSLFRKIIDDCTEMPNLQHVQILGLGEPLIDPDLFNKLRYVQEKLPNVTIWLYTNGSLLTDDVVEKLSTVNNLIVDFSLNGITKEERYNNMRLDDFDHVVSMIRKYSKYGKRYSVSLVNYPGTDPKECDVLDKMFEGNKWIIFVTFSNWLGKIPSPEGYEPIVRNSCSRAVTYLNVMYDGKVNLCCQDAMGQCLFGNLNKNSVKEVWESPQRQHFAKEHLKGCRKDLPYCGSCSVYG
jgi:radical SAM protein with 4Fe4S-binding SPASM domain